MYRSTLAPLLVLAIPGLTQPAEAQHFPTDAELLELIQGRVEEGRATGIVLGVLEADGTQRVVAFGDPGRGAKPLDRESVFEIGSISKAFTGILLADMAAEGLLSIEDPVQEHVPEDVTMPGRPEQVIRLVDLAMHRSGLPRLPSNMQPADMSNPYVDYTADMMYDFLKSYELQRDVGAEYEYSNLGVGLLGYLLAVKSGVDYGALVKTRILDPLGMKHSGITITSSMESRLVKGHDATGTVVPYWDFSTLAGAGALRSNVHDMLRFLDANIGEPKSDLERSMRTSHRLPEGASGGVALCWHLQRVGQSTLVWHNGGTGGFRTFAGFDPDLEVGVVVLTNSSHGADDIGMHLLNHSLPLTAPPQKRTEARVERSVMERYVGVYELIPEFQLTVTMDAKGLGVQATNQQRIELYPESETKFFMKVVDAQVEFVIEDGEVTAVVLHQGGAAQRAKRLD